MLNTRLEVGITGNRYSGVDTISNLYDKLGVPIFYADVVIKFLLNKNYEIIEEIRNFLPEYFSDDYVIDYKKITKDNKFQTILNIIEPELFRAYSNFSRKYYNRMYIIFSSSILFEMDWQKKFDLVVDVYAPMHERYERSKKINNIGKFDAVSNIKKSFKEVIDENKKKELADYIIYNNDISTVDVLKQVDIIDKNIIEYYYDIKYFKQNTTKNLIK